MPNEQPSINIDLTPEYKQNLRNLSKRFRNIRSDVQPIPIAVTTRRYSR